MEGEVIMADNTQMIGYQKTIAANNRKIKKFEDEISELESMQRKMQSLQRQLDTSANAAFQKVSSISGKVRHGINMNFFSGLSNVLKSNKYQNAIGNIENANRKIRNKITQNKQEIQRLKKQIQNCHNMIQKIKTQAKG